MKKLLLPIIAAFILQILIATTVVFAVETLTVVYTIHVRLDPETKRLHASEVIRYMNRSTVAIPDLHFHLYFNAFKNEKSTFARERGGKLHGLKDKWGWVDLHRLSIDGVDAVASLEYIQPDDHNPDDQTVVTLKSPLLPDQTVTIKIEFEAQLPRVYVRTGYQEDYVFVAQWFPKLDVWEPSGILFERLPLLP